MEVPCDDGIHGRNEEAVNAHQAETERHDRDDLEFPQNQRLGPDH